MSRVLGIDYGLRKIGLALADGEWAEPLMVIGNKKEKVLHALQLICQKETIGEIVIGLPESGLVKEIQKFGSDLAKITGLVVSYQDENLTTQDAIVRMIAAGKSRKARKKDEDAVAAALILQSWLDQKNA
jgi:putative Holliday junction resolvase